MSIIKNKDIYDGSEGSPFKPIINAIELLDAKISELKANLSGLEIKVKNGGNEKELIKNVQTLSDETRKLNALQKKN